MFASDLRAAGHDVRCVLVHPTALDQLGPHLEGAELLLLDSIFPFALQRRLRALSDAPLLVGGHNALQHALRGPTDYALVGAARSTLLPAVEAIASGRPEAAAGLVWKEAEVLRAGPPAPDRRPADEVLPFTPDLDWDYVGPPRAAGSNLRIPSVVAELGCVWNRTALRQERYVGVAPRLPSVEADASARAVLEAFVDREGGCTFCTFRFQPRRGHRLDRAVDLAVTQIRTLLALGATGTSLQTEHPLPLLVPLLDALDGAGLAGRVGELHLRTIPWLLLRHQDELRRGITRARELGVRLVLGQVGFEAFDDASLAVYNKGISAADNAAAAELLGRLHREHEHFEGIHGHGLVPLHPWATPESVRENVAVARRVAPWLLPSLGPFNRIELYNEWTPLFWALEDDGLLAPDPEGFGWSWRYADARMEELTAATASILARARAAEPASVMDEVARVLMEQPDPARRRADYLALRARLGGG